MKELKKLSEEVLRESVCLVQSITYENGQLNAKVSKGTDEETKTCGICLVLGMIIIHILFTNKIKDKENIKMLKELHKTIDNTFNMLDFLGGLYA